VNHDELLAEIKSLNDSCSISSRLGNALKAVVELHEPNRNGGCSECLDHEVYGTETHKRYPCPAIQAIEKELK